MKHRNIIRSIFAAVAVEYPPSEASAAGISPERSENCEAISLEVCSMRGAGGAWADVETVGGYTWTYRINGDTAESLV